MTCQCDLDIDAAPIDTSSIPSMTIIEGVPCLFDVQKNDRALLRWKFWGRSVFKGKTQCANASTNAIKSGISSDDTPLRFCQCWESRNTSPCPATTHTAPAIFTVHTATCICERMHVTTHVHAVGSAVWVGWVLGEEVPRLVQATYRCTRGRPRERSGSNNWVVLIRELYRWRPRSLYWPVARAPSCWRDWLHSLATPWSDFSLSPVQNHQRAFSARIMYRTK